MDLLMNVRRTICSITTLLILSSTCIAQSWSEHFSAEAGYVSTYIYRGLKLANSTAYAMLHYTQGNFKATAETGMAFSGEYKETMLSASYKLGDFTLGVRDLYFPVYEGVKSLGYFNWNPEETSHQVEALLTYAPEKLPIKVQWSTFVAGYDLKYEYDDEGNFYWGKRAYSSYLELTAFHKFPHMHTVAATAGASVNRGFYTAFAKDFSVVHLRASYSKTWVWHNLYPTAGAYVAYNPYADKLYPIAYLSLSF